MKPLLSCREAAHLLMLATERELGLAERLALRVHLLMCTGCNNFERQLRLMHQATARWRQYSEE